MLVRLVLWAACMCGVRASGVAVGGVDGIDLSTGDWRCLSRRPECEGLEKFFGNVTCRVRRVDIYLGPMYEAIQTHLNTHSTTDIGLALPPRP